MKLVAIVGPIDKTGKKLLHESLESTFQVMEIASKEDYPKMKDAHYVILRTLRMEAEDIQKMPNLQLIQRWGAGFDSVDIQAAGQQNIQVAVTAGINSIPVAEYAVLMMMGVYRNLIAIHTNVKDGNWRAPNLIDRSYVINGKTVGLIGLGIIGKQVAKRVQAFGASVIYYDPFRLTDAEEKDLDITYQHFEDVIRNSDIISLHLPLTEESRNLVDAKVIRMMKPTAVLINTARGGIVQEQDLYEALQEGRILGAGLDVFEQEPIATDHPFLSLDNVVLSSHSAGNTADNSVNIAMRCVENIFAVDAGKILNKPDLVNGDFLN